MLSVPGPPPAPSFHLLRLAQDNGSDCGAFAVAFASYLSDGLPFDFSQADITQMRRRMLWSLVHQELV